MDSTTMKQSTSKPRIVGKAQAQQDVLSFVTQPEHALPLVGMLAQAQFSIEDLLGQISKGFIEQLLVLSAQQVAGAKHPGRHVGDVRWHGTQAGQVNIGKAKLKVTRPRLRDRAGEVPIPAYQALHADERLGGFKTEVQHLPPSKVRRCKVPRPSAINVSVQSTHLDRTRPAFLDGSCAPM